MTLNQFLSIMTISAGVLAGIAYILIKRLYSHKYRVAEITMGQVTWYMPQVKIKGIWFNIGRDWDDDYNYYITTHEPFNFLSPNDAINFINEYKVHNKIKRYDRYVYVD